MRALLLCCALVVPALQGDDLDAVLGKVAATRDGPWEQRARWIRELCGIGLVRARRAALDLYRREPHPVLRARLLEHAMKLPVLDRSVDLDPLMLRELEAGAGLAIRVVAARYFVEVRGNQGVDLCLALRAEKKDPEVDRAVLAAFGAQPNGTRGSTLFVRDYEASPPTTKLAVLKELRGRGGGHLDRMRRAALDDPYLPLRGEAMRQLAAQGDASMARLARRAAGGKGAAKLAPVLFEVLARAPAESDLVTLGALRRYRSSRMRRLVKAAVARLRQAEGVFEWAVGPGREHRDAYVRGFALRLLEAGRGAAVRDALYDLCSDPDAENRRRAIFALAKRKDRRIVSLLEKHLGRGRVEQRLDALDALDMILGDEASFQLRLVDLARSGPAEQRLLAIDLAGRHGLRGLLPEVGPWLAHRDWRVRAAAVRYARRVRARATVPLLIGALQRARGRFAADLKRALSSLTRLYFERAADWQKWWAASGADFELPPAGAAAPARPAATAGAATSAVFYGIPVASDRVVYCLDVSGSMSKLAGTGVTRLRIAQQALIQTLAKSPKGSFVNVLFFANEVHGYRKKMVRLAGAKEMERLVAFIRQQKALGGTNIHDTLVAALADRRVDTIFLLSDGDPTEGEITDPAELAGDIARRNRGRGVTIHTVAIGGPNALLQQLAAETGGDYVVQK